MRKRIADFAASGLKAIDDRRPIADSGRFDTAGPRCCPGGMRCKAQRECGGLTYHPGLWLTYPPGLYPRKIAEDLRIETSSARNQSPIVDCSES